MSKPVFIRYRDYDIYSTVHGPIGWVEYEHRNYDGPGDRRIGTAATVEEAKIEIDEIEDER